VPDAFDALAIGEAMAVLCPDPPQPLRGASTLHLSVAGAEANVAVHLAGLGLRAGFRSRVGDDPFGQLIADRLGTAGVTADLSVDPLAPTGVYFKDPAATGTRVHYYRAGSAASTMDDDLWADCAPARLVHLSGITPALSPNCARLVTHGLTERPIPDAIMSFDVNYRPSLWPPAIAGPILATLANLADVVFVGLDEATALWGTDTAADVRALIDRPDQLVVKDGGHGATLFTRDSSTFAPAMAIDVVEPVGAGDAFAAGYLYGLLRDQPDRERLRLGHVLAATALVTIADIGSPPRPADLAPMATKPPDTVEEIDEL
jgi:2-dehydro-3-deoxygluconokinase